MDEENNLREEERPEPLLPETEEGAGAPAEEASGEEEIPALLLPEEEENDESAAEEPSEEPASPKKPKMPKKPMKLGRPAVLAICAAVLIALIVLLLVLTHRKTLGLDIAVTEETTDFAPAPASGTLDLTGTVLAPVDALGQMNDAGAAAVLCTLEVCGQEVDSAAEELDLTGASADDIILKDIEDAVFVMPNLQKVLLPDETNYTDEELSAFNDRLGDVRAVWTIHLTSFDLRTDTTYFCANVDNWTDAVTSEDTAKLVYCTDMIALDLGHRQNLNDFTFLASMPQLKYLVLSDTCLYDLEPLSGLHDLVYLEIFMTHFTDITPLTSLTNLQYLNIGYTYYFDRTPLEQMTWLKYLWYPGNYLSAEMKTELTEALPDTEVYLVYNDTDGSTGGGWRETDGYYEMRDALHMPYMDDYG